MALYGMSLILYKVVAASLIFFISLLAVIYPLKARTHPSHHWTLELGDAFASGIFLGAALFHMLPDAINAFSLTLQHSTYPLAELICAGGFLLLLFFERLSGNIHQHGSSIPFVIAIIIIIHSFIEGTTIGLNTTLATASIITLAIIVHKSSESFTLAVMLNRSNLLLRQTLAVIAIFALMTPLGIALGTTLTLYLHERVGMLLTAGFNAFAAGTFLYMSTLHHINHHQRSHEGEGLFEYFALVTGLGMMALVALWS